MIFSALFLTSALWAADPAQAPQPEPLLALDQQVCFSPDESCDEKLTQALALATKSVDLAIYDINLDPLVHQLLLQHKKIQVRIVVDQRQAKGQHSLVSTLIKAGAQIRFGHQRGIMHNKFMIIDEKILETGSFNYTHHASKANQENQVYLASAPIVKRYHERFEKMWATAKPAHGAEGL